jgi:predicted XRE-type DNA-binding protein
MAPTYCVILGSNGEFAEQLHFKIVYKVEAYILKIAYYGTRTKTCEVDRIKLPRFIQMSKKIGTKVHETRVNIFADLGLDHADGLHAKSGLVFRISEILKKRKLTQAQAAAILGIDQPKVSKLLRGQLAGFSTDRLFRFLNALDCDIEIVVKPKARSATCAEVRVRAA